MSDNPDHRPERDQTSTKRAVIAVVLVACIGTIGSIAGQRFQIVSASAFGTAGEWTAAAATVATVFIMGEQVRRARLDADRTIERERKAAIDSLCKGGGWDAGRVRTTVQILTTYLPGEVETLRMISDLATQKFPQRKGFKVLAPCSFSGFDHSRPRAPEAYRDDLLKLIGEQIGTGGSNLALSLRTHIDVLRALNSSVVQMADRFDHFGWEEPIQNCPAKVKLNFSGEHIDAITQTEILALSAWTTLPTPRSFLAARESIDSMRLYLSKPWSDALKDKLDIGK